MRFRRRKVEDVPLPELPRTIVLSPKAQFYLEYIGVDVDELSHIAALRDAYLRARTSESINNISTYEMERIVRNGLTLATKKNI